MRLFYFLSLLIFISCSNADFRKKNLLESKVGYIFPEMRILRMSDLDDDTKEYFGSLNLKTEPGYYCNYLFDRDRYSCAVLLVKKKENIHESKMLVFLKDLYRTNEYDVIEDYSKESRQSTNIFIQFQEKQVLNEEEGKDSSVSMDSDGILRISYGQSAMVFFNTDRGIKKVWIAD